MNTSETYDFKFYDWEDKLRDKPFLKQPFGDVWEIYTWGEVGQYARKLATGLKSLGLRENAHIGLVSKDRVPLEFLKSRMKISISAKF